MSTSGVGVVRGIQNSTRLGLGLLDSPITCTFANFTTSLIYITYGTFHWFMPVTKPCFITIFPSCETQNPRENLEKRLVNFGAGIQAGPGIKQLLEAMMIQNSWR